MREQNILFQWLRCVLFAISFLLLSIFTRNNSTELSKWWSVIVIAINFITLGILLWFCKVNRMTFSGLINYIEGSTRPPSVVWVTFLFLAIGMGGMYLAGYLCYGKFPYLATIMIKPMPITFAIISFVLLPVTTMLAEDGLYLGLGVNQINCKWIAILYPALFYALQHSFIPLIFDFKFMLYRFLSFLPLTMVLCWLYYKKRNPVPIMIGHFVINLATVIQIMLTSLSPEVYEKLLKM